MCPSQHAEHNELRNHTLNVKACYEGKGFLQTLTALSCSRPAEREPVLRVYIALLGYKYECGL